MRIHILAATTARRRAISRAVEYGCAHVGHDTRTLGSRQFLAETTRLAWKWGTENGCSEADAEQAQEEASRESSDVLVIDHAGTGPNGHPLSSSAETIRLVRMAGTCRIVIAVDTTAHSFDGEHLFGDPDSPADLAVRLVDLANRALWARKPGKGTAHPAYWPEMLCWTGRRQRQMQNLLENEKRPVVDVLGLSRNAQRALTRRQCGRLAPRSKSIARLGWVTAWMDADTSLPIGQRKRIHEQARHGRPWAKWRARRARAEAAAAWLDRWVRLELLPVSVPTLSLHEVLELYPGILRGSGAGTSRQVSRANDGIGTDGAGHTRCGLPEEVWHGNEGPGLRTARIGAEEWYPTPVFDRETVNGMAWQWQKDLETTTELGFCEASSRYFDRSGKTWYRVQPVQENARARTLSVHDKTMEPRNRIETVRT